MRSQPSELARSLALCPSANPAHTDHSDSVSVSSSQGIHVDPGASGGAVTFLLTPSLGSKASARRRRVCPYLSPYIAQVTRPGTRPDGTDRARRSPAPPAPAACLCVGWRVGGGRCPSFGRLWFRLIWRDLGDEETRHLRGEVIPGSVSRGKPGVDLPLGSQLDLDRACASPLRRPLSRFSPSRPREDSSVLHLRATHSSRGPVHSLAAEQHIGLSPPSLAQ